MKYKVYLEKGGSSQAIDEKNPTAAARNYMAWLNPETDDDVVVVDSTTGTWKFIMKREVYYTPVKGTWVKK